ncbi:MAG: hypothetical protein ACJ79S_15915 [Gemmatimonadaceae bacterium]
MDTQQASGDRLDAQMRAADARLDQMEAQARARNARAEMDEISGLRARRDQVRQKVEQAKKEMKDDREIVRAQMSADWADVRREIADAHNRYTAWDDARERRFTAHLDQADAFVREQGAKDAEVGADVGARLAEARQDLRDKAAAARRSYDAWRERRSDQAAQRKLDDAELELEEASNRYAAAREGVQQRGRPARAD